MVKRSLARNRFKERVSSSEGVNGDKILGGEEIERSRRGFLKGLIAAGVVGGIGLIAGKDYFFDEGLEESTTVFSKPRRSNSEKPKQGVEADINGTDDLNKLHLETSADHKILQLEAGYETFANKLLPLIETLEDKDFKATLEDTFLLVFHNAKVNKERNVMTLARNRGHGIDDYIINVPTTQFFYQFKNMPLDRTAASFDTTARKMTLVDDFDSDNDVDNLVLLHELVHVFYDSVLRQGLQTENQWSAYRELYRYEIGGKPKLNLSDEAIAISCELEAMNLLLNNELREAAQNGGKLNVRGIKKRLGVESLHQEGPLNFTLSVAMNYFRGTGKFGKFPKTFLDQVARVAVRNGYEVYMPGSDGGVVPYR